MSSVAAILEEVRLGGDAALREWAIRLDGVEPARAEPAPGLPEDALLELADAVRRWHEAQRPSDVRLEVRPGVELERRWTPLASVGIYVPRGLVSTLVMCAVPALVAGVDRIAVATPPDGAGLVAAAARLLGIDEVWALGGPPAIAAFAYGTETIPRVDKICGPGGAYVNEAKLLVSREVAIDLPAGPSEVVVLAGQRCGSARRGARARRPGRARPGLALPSRGRRRRCGGSGRGGRRDRAGAPRRPRRGCRGARRRGSATRARSSSGQFSSVAAGDYATGGNHVLPTGGWARAVGGIGLETFLKPVTIQRLTAAGLASVRPTVEALAAAEGMPAHAAAVRR